MMCFSQQQKTYNETSSCFNSCPSLVVQRCDSESSRADSVSDVINEALKVATLKFPDTIPNDLEPTPIVEPLHVRVASDERRLGSSTWNGDDSSIELLRLLLTQREKQDEDEVQNSTNNIQSSSSDQLDEYDPIPVKYSSSSSSQTMSEGAIKKIQGWSSGTTTTIVGTNDTDPQGPESWKDRFQQLVQFRNQFGHCLVPHNWSDNRGLSSWVKRQRYQYKLRNRGRHTTLTDDRMQSLQNIGFVWSSQSLRWEEKLQELTEFANEHGHCNVPSIYPSNRQLSIWVRSQRRQFKLYLEGSKTANMTTERIQKLKSLGFNFLPRPGNFKVQF